MAKFQNHMQAWDLWQTESLGAALLKAEQHYLSSILTDCYGKYGLLIGVPQQQALFKYSTIPNHVLLGPLQPQNPSLCYVASELDTLPIATASTELVLLPHTLEYVGHPQQLLLEACRVVKPEGYIVIFGFNPYSFWGLWKKCTKQHSAPWSSDFIALGKVREWLIEEEFQIVKQDKFLFRPPLQTSLYHYLKPMEWIGSKLWIPFGGVYVLVAKARSLPLTLMRANWKERFLSGSLPIAGPTTTRNGPE